MMSEDDEDVEHGETNRRHDEEVDSSNVLNVIPEERPPCGRRRTTRTNHVFLDGRLGDIDADLGKFAGDTRCTPRHIGRGHLADELVRFDVDSQATDPTAAAELSPVATKTTALPSKTSCQRDQCLDSQAQKTRSRGVRRRGDLESL